MGKLDYLTIVLYFAGILAISVASAWRISDHKDMFTTNRSSPWWAAGLSGFMTMFSAATFVVWGGIAYRLGLVAVMINACYGVAALLAGYFVAGRWNRLGVTTPAEYVNLRFGKTGLHLFTWTMLLKRILGVSVSLYALAVLLVALVPLGEANPLSDPNSGNLAMHWAILFFGSVVVIYTMVGGLWAVLMTDVLQFIVLLIVVFLISILMIFRAPSYEMFQMNAPDGFFSLTAGGYGWLFLFGWVTIHFFMVGAEWAFVQRFLAVRSPQDARKSCYLFGAMYLLTPLFWLLPPLLYRGQVFDAKPEQAYILAAQSVLPPGVIGLFVAAMFSATASMVSSQLNVFAGVLTNDFYLPLVNPTASQQQLIRVGRFFTLLLGALLVLVALLVPRLGGAEKLIIDINSLMVVPLLSPALWGLFSRRIGIKHMITVAVTSFALGAVLKFGVLANPYFDFLKWNVKNVEVLVGVILPVVMLGVYEWRLRTSEVDPGWIAIDAHEAASAIDASTATLRDDANNDRVADNFPKQVLSIGLGSCGVLMLAFSLFTATDQQVLVAMGVVLLSAAAACHFVMK